MGELVTTLGVDLGVIIGQAIAFAILFVALKKWLWGPVMNFLDERTKEVKNTYAAAEKARDEVQDLRAEYETRIAKIEEQAQERMAEAIKKGQVMAHEIVESARREANLEKEKAMNAIREETGKARIQLRDYSVSLAFGIASKALHKEVNQKAHEDIVEQFLSELKAGGNA